MLLEVAQLQKWPGQDSSPGGFQVSSHKCSPAASPWWPTQASPEDSVRASSDIGPEDVLTLDSRSLQFTPSGSVPGAGHAARIRVDTCAHLCVEEGAV